MKTCPLLICALLVCLLAYEAHSYRLGRKWLIEEIVPDEVPAQVDDYEPEPSPEQDWESSLDEEDEQNEEEDDHGWRGSEIYEDLEAA